MVDEVPEETEYSKQFFEDSSPEEIQEYLKKCSLLVSDSDNLI